MNEDLERRLQKISPQLFTPHFYFECGDGWFSLLQGLICLIDKRAGYHAKAIEGKRQAEEGNQEVPNWVQEYLNQHPENPYHDFRIIQVKEKFGTLRVYFSGMASDAKEESAYINGLVEYAELMSAITCENCGNPGERRSLGWVKTLCDDCVFLQRADVTV